MTLNMDKDRTIRNPKQDEVHKQLVHWEKVFTDYLSRDDAVHDDASHDMSHFSRVYRTAKHIAGYEREPADFLVLLAAAYFHDIVSLPKDHADAKLSSRYASVKAKQILHLLHFPDEKIEPVCKAIETHSFSSGLQPETYEAKIIQDADRMEALGAIGAMRTFYVSGRLGREPFDVHDLYAKQRPLDDKMFGLDHFYCKLFKLPALLQTEGGRILARKRTDFLTYFVEELDANIKSKAGGALILVKACQLAGHRYLHLFDAKNPLARNRPLQTTCFVVDLLLEIREQFPVFIDTFLIQLEEEIDGK